jgi:uncharacterized protein (DUF2141 family)
MRTEFQNYPRQLFLFRRTDGNPSHWGRSFTKRCALLMVMLLPLLLLPALSAQSVNTGTLTVRVVNARNANGEIRVALFKDAQGFPGDASLAFRTQRAQIDPHTLSATVVFTEIPQGVYAVSVFHDENGNGRLDKNFVGIPKEEYGASNNPAKKMGPPAFDEAKFSLGIQQLLEIRLVH